MEQKYMEIIMKLEYSTFLNFDIHSIPKSHIKKNCKT